jgi:hypothetical protein
LTFFPEAAHTNHWFGLNSYVSFTVAYNDTRDNTNLYFKPKIIP